VLAAGIAYLFMMPIDKAAIEKQMTSRLGETVTVGSASFSPFPPTLTLTNVNLGGILTLPSVTATPDPVSLTSNRKIWRSIDVANLSIEPQAIKKLAALVMREIPKSLVLPAEIQRLRLTNVQIVDPAIAWPKLDATLLLTSAGPLKQATVSTYDGKAQLVLSPDDKGVMVDFESRGVQWPLGPKVAWESLRSKGYANAQGYKAESISITAFSGTATGSGEFSWSGPWMIGGQLDVSGYELEPLSQALLGGQPFSGSFEGKFNFSMKSDDASRLLDTPQIDGPFILSKAVVRNIDLAAFAKSDAQQGGQTRFSDASGKLSTSGGKLMLRDLRGTANLLNVTGSIEVAPNRNVSGDIAIDLGAGPTRVKAAVKASGTWADPKLTKQ
jgi:hypothetical protein